MPHRAMAKDNVAVSTGGASGIGLAAAMRVAALGMKVCVADIGDAALKAAEARMRRRLPTEAPTLWPPRSMSAAAMS
jgi:NAD(P)-dependent dehydrogenase (short-subunit alcohol dehydrogenase family)